MVFISILIGKNIIYQDFYFEFNNENK